MFSVGYLLFDRDDRSEQLYRELIDLSQWIGEAHYDEEEDDDDDECEHEDHEPLYELVAAQDGLGSVYISQNRTADAEKILREAALNGRKAIVKAKELQEAEKAAGHFTVNKGKKGKEPVHGALISTWEHLATVLHMQAKSLPKPSHQIKSCYDSIPSSCSSFALAFSPSLI